MSHGFCREALCFPFLFSDSCLGHFGDLIVLQFRQVHGSADDEGAAGNGHNCQGFIEEDKAPQGVKEDADISDEADHNGVGRGIGVGHPDLSQDAHDAEGQIEEPVRSRRNDKVPGQGHDDDPRQGGADEKVHDHFIRMVTAGSGQFADRRIGAGGKDGLAQGEQGIDVEGIEIPRPNDEAGADKNDDQRPFRARRQDFFEEHGRKEHDEKGRQLGNDGHIGERHAPEGIEAADHADAAEEPPQGQGRYVPI